MYSVRFIIIALSVVLFSYTGCEKTKFSTAEVYSGTATATINGDQTWQARTLISDSRLGDRYPNTYSIHIDVYNENSLLRESITAILVNPYPDTIIPFIQGPIFQEDTILPNFAYTTSQDDGDVVCFIYEPDTTFDNYFIVDKFDPDTYQVSGQFSLRCIKNKNTVCELPLKDTITLTNGRFTTNGLYRGE